MENLRTPFLILALLLIAVAVLFEVGSLALDKSVVGLGIPSLALLYGLVLAAAALLTAALLMPARVHGRLQAISILIVSVLVLLAALRDLFVWLGELILMVTLLLSPPFGTAAYFIGYGDFERAKAAVALSFLLLLGIGFAVFLVLAQQRFLQNKSLVLLTLTALLGAVIVSFLHGLVPGFLVSITDAIGAIVVAILAIIWSIVLLVMSIPGIVRVLRVDRST